MLHTATMNYHNDGGLCYLTFPLFDKAGVRHAFTTRQGGVSTGDCGEFNTSFSREGYEAVYENYRRICEKTGIDEKRLILSAQTHTDNIRVVTADDIGKGIVKPLDYTDVDGLISSLSGAGLVTQYADCTPLVFYDTDKKIIATSHAGWRGTALQIGKKTVERMTALYGSSPENIIAGIGPCIDSCCYEVDDPVYNAFAGIRNFDRLQFFKRKNDGKYMFDLKGANRQILINAGIRPENIDVSDLCTCCNHEYLHSHRYTGGRRGNMALIIWQ